MLSPSVRGIAARRGIEQRARDLHLEREQRVGERLPLSVEPERHRAPAPQRFVQQEIERPEVRHLVALHPAEADALEAALDQARGERAREPRIDLGRRATTPMLRVPPFHRFG